MKRSTVILSLITVAVLLIMTAIFVASRFVGDAQGAVPQEHHLFAALDSMSLGKDADDPRQFCVTTLRNREGDGKTYCTDLQNVAVYTDEKAQGGTYADILTISKLHIHCQALSLGIIHLTPQSLSDTIESVRDSE